jgi:hypothetical protein
MVHRTCDTSNGLRGLKVVPRCVILDFSGVPAEDKAFVDAAADYLVSLMTHYATTNGHKLLPAVKESGLPADGLQSIVEDGRIHVFTATEPTKNMKEAKQNAYSVDVAHLLEYVQ